jgi:hypothetical protein
MVCKGKLRYFYISYKHLCCAWENCVTSIFPINIYGVHGKTAFLYIQSVVDKFIYYLIVYRMFQEIYDASCVVTIVLTCVPPISNICQCL